MIVANTLDDQYLAKSFITVMLCNNTADAFHNSNIVEIIILLINCEPPITYETF